MSPACVVGSSDDDEDDTLDTLGDTTLGATSTSTGPSAGCVNVLQDPGFEQGTPNPYWQVTSSVLETPICDSSCSDTATAAAHGGVWWVWFGGLLDPDTASVSQQLVFTTNVSELHFFYQVWPGTESGDDSFTVRVDGEVLFTVTDSQDVEQGAYVGATVDVSRFADGAVHTLSFQANTSGVGQSSFFIDDVALYDCGAIAGTTSGSSTSTTTEGDTSEGTSSSGDVDDSSTGSTSEAAEASSSSGAGESSESGETSSSGGTEESTGEASTGEASSGAESSSGGGTSEESSGSTGG